MNFYDMNITLTDISSRNKTLPSTQVKPSCALSQYPVLPFPRK